MEKRFILFIVLSMLIVLATNYYVYKTTPPKPQPAGTQPAPSPTAAAPIREASPTPESRTEATTTPEPVRRADAPKVSLKTKVYEIEFSTQGAVPVRWDIIDSRFVVPPSGVSREEARKRGLDLREPLIDPVMVQSELLPRPFETILKERNATRFYNELNTGLYDYTPVTEGGRKGFRFTAKAATESGLRMNKTWLFDTDGFLGKLEIELVNEGKSELAFDGGGTGLGLVLGPGLGKPATGAMARWSQVSAVVKTPSGFEYQTVKEPGKVVPFAAQSIQWGGLQTLYFIGALIPGPGTSFVAARAQLDRDLANVLPATLQGNAQTYSNVELYGRDFNMGPGTRVKYSYELFVGPKQRQILKSAGHDLPRVLFYDSWSWMRALELGLMGLLDWLHRMLRNWGIAIIMLTIIVRLVTFPLVQKGLNAQAKMAAEQARIKPLMDKINEKFKNDPQRKQQEIFKLYKEHGVNPFGMLKGCVWIIIQMPIFIALYYVINQSIDLRGAQFMWIKDLSQPDRLFTFGFSLPVLGNEFNLLPLLMTVTQVLTSKLATQPTADPEQLRMQKMMIYIMPVMMLIFFYGMPAGLVLYWFVSNLWQVGQQLYVNKHMRKPAAAALPATGKA